MPLRLEAITFEVDDPAPVAAFWAELLERETITEPDGALVPGNETQVGLRFMTSGTGQIGPRRLHLHLHLTSRSRADQEQIVARALDLGGRHLDVGQLPEDDFIVLADPGDNELCVIGPDNTFLAGAGRLGEVTCDGTRDVGLFWRDALGWTLVWDQDEETSIQSPSGGTKVSWGGPPVEPKRGRNRQRFDTLAGDLDEEVDRLVSLGALVLADGADGVELADLDGNEFTIRKGPASDLPATVSD